MTNVGIHPTINLLSKPHIETYIFDFKGNIYNKSVKLLFYKKTRDETKFASLSDLKTQLVHDEKEIRNYFINLDWKKNKWYIIKATCPWINESPTLN